MGLGTMEYFSGLLGNKYKKRKQFQTVELKVKMDCDGCVRKVKNALSNMKGVQSLDINRKQNKVTVTGYIEPGKVVRKLQATGKKAEIWPYIPYNLVAHPYSAQTYDKKAPPGYVRNVEAMTGFSHEERQEEKLTNMFSDENPNACSVM
ncbi:Heavy metal-associated isoprenylated plant protein 26 [Rhynchospora pubera]|uniref:Heavy metal-associated isoprenylated plant protein 26 n=1 Tax=Rhynchospora pubera TaxID=906938 RepID=A0AAV8HAV9_9POAL|nr:Heavy metal-associated isoprenylated plant protein 26 [Rhynchospora pubera]